MRLGDLKKTFKKIPKRIWALALIMALGIFLRTYHFHDWLVFNPDQARDAAVVDNVLSGRTSWIILGPEAGNSHFQLGPWFYHLEIVSAKIFGSAPDTMAYPDLLFSVLAIPLFYIFLKKYFSTKTSLALTGLYAMSFFAVRFSRFAWNPNSIPFFVLLFLLGMLYLFEVDRKKSFFGAALVGIGIGVGIQLHVLLLFIMPIVAIPFFFFQFFKKQPFLMIFGKIGITLAFLLITNTGQIVYELNHGNSNLKRFMKSINTEVKVKPGKNLQMDFLCQSQANLHLVSSFGNKNQCDSYEVLGRLQADSQAFFVYTENKVSLYIIIVSALFSLVGYILLVYFWKKEADQRRRIFLALVGSYGIATLIAMFSIMDQVEIRYYIVLFFLPFVFLGVMADGVLRFRKIWAKIIIVLIFAYLLVLNGSAEANTAEKFFSMKANDEKFIFLGETNRIAEYLITASGGSRTIYLRGQKIYEKRYFKPLNYILAKRGFDLASPSSDEGDSIHDGPVFFIIKTRLDKDRIGDKIGGYNRIAQMTRFNDATIVVPSDDEID
jgi:4-amino-4-deoxy-L-arabinose transferase-like glycosyltransferase